MAQIVTGVTGIGVLSLSWSVAQLGWIFGPLSVIFFAATTLFASFLLAECYRHPDPEYGHIRNRSFLEATELYLGETEENIAEIQKKGKHKKAIVHLVFHWKILNISA